MRSAVPLWKPFLEASSGLLPVDRLFDGVPDIVFFIKDAGGRYMAVNDTLAARCGLANKDQALGRTARELFPEPLGGAFEQQDQSILAGGPPIRDHLELHLYPGGRGGWCLTYKEPVPGRHGKPAGLCGISRDIRASGARDEDYGPLSAALAHIQRHFDEPLRLADLAEIAGMSVYQFDQRIRALFRVTAGQYLVKTRIDHACRLLAAGREPIVRIALGSGYSDQSAFSRQFKQVVGISPLAYRRRARAE